MKEKYLINNSVYFYPAQQLLVPISEEYAQVSLNVPASRCLTLLLEKKGEIVTKYDLSQDVWQSRGQYTSANTLYQNISLIRKALREVGISHDTIHTIPREGFSFLGTAILMQEDNAPAENVSQAGAASKEKRHDVSVSYNMKIINNDYSAHDIYSPTQHKIPEINPGPPQKTSISPLKATLNFIDIVYQYKWRSISAAILLMLSIFTFYYYLSDNTHDYFKNYYSIGDINNCTLMKSEKDKLRQKADYFSIFQQKNIHCETAKNVYIAMDTRATKIFMHFCNKNTDDTSSCFSTFFIER